MKKVKENLITKGWMTSVGGIFVSVFIGALIWTGRVEIMSTVPLMVIAALLFGVKDSKIKKWLGFKK